MQKYDLVDRKAKEVIDDARGAKVEHVVVLERTKNKISLSSNKS